MSWWEGYPWRMIQTNLRETDMEDIDAEKYADDLKDFGATVVLLNAAGILASYDTDLSFQTQSEHLHGSTLKEIVDACHARGIRVIARTDFSKVRYSLYEKHPEWAYRTKEGDIVSYNGDVHMCPNGDYQQKYMLEILKEVLTKIPFDGVFCNMSGFQVVDYDYNFHGACYCEACQKKYRKMFGTEIPDVQRRLDANYLKYQGFTARCTKEHRKDIVETIRAISPEIAINGTDYIRTESNTEIGRGQWVYSASGNSRLTSGPLKLRPSDNACVDFLGFRYRDVSVSPELVSLRQWQNLANAGSASLYIMGRLDNHKDVSSYAPTKRAFAFHAAHEDLFTTMKSAAEVVLVNVRPAGHPGSEDYEGWIRVLTEAHIPFDEIKMAELKDAKQLEGKKAVILGENAMLSDDLASLLDNFAAEGGVVIAEGETGMMSMALKPTDTTKLQCLGIKKVLERRSSVRSATFEIRPEDETVFTRSSKTPYLAFGERLVTCEYDEDTEKYLRLIDEHPYGPPERCYYTDEDLKSDAGVFVHHHGKGLGIYLPYALAEFYYNEGYSNSRTYLEDILFNLAHLTSVAPSLTHMVEVTVNHAGKDGEKMLVQLVNTSGFFGNSYFEPIPVQDVTVRIPGEWKSARALNGADALIEQKDGCTEVRISSVKEYEAVVLE